VTEKALKRKIPLPPPPKKKKKRKRKSKQSVCCGLSTYVIKMSLWIRRRTQKAWTTSEEHSSKHRLNLGQSSIIIIKTETERRA
jgi:hypothetical protein